MSGFMMWVIQRITAVVILAYTAVLTTYVIYWGQNLDFTRWVTLHQYFEMRIFSSLFLIAVVWHAFIGIWTVVTDYIHRVLIRRSIELISFIGLFAWAISGIAIVWGVV